MQFTKEQIKLLAESERLMDEGLIAFVMLDGQRISVSQEAMAEFGLRQGQTINNTIFMELLKFNIADCEAKIAEQKLSSLRGEA